MNAVNNFISSEQAGTIDGLFRKRAQATPNTVAYRYYDVVNLRWRDVKWHEMAQRVAKWRAALMQESLSDGACVALMMRNSCEWVVYEQAALSLGLVIVPLYVNDRPDNIAYIVNETKCEVLLIEGQEHWRALRETIKSVTVLKRIVVLDHVKDDEDKRLVMADDWLPDAGSDVQHQEGDPDSLATIVFTSGTTGRPKGVMLSHRNILDNAQASSVCVPVKSDDLFLSFLPLSHMFERTTGYMLPMMAGAQVAFARSIPLLGEDLMTVQPTVMISVPRIYERVYGKIQDQLASKSPIAKKLFMSAIATGWKQFEYEQGRAKWSPDLLLWPVLKKIVADKVMAKLGGRVRVAICGGAPLAPDVAKLFIGLGLTLLQGYGLTETSPVIAGNSAGKNIPASIGSALDGVEVRIAESGELQTRSSSVMMGYWNNAEATADMIDADGWLHTGDKARIDDEGYIYITGRIKDIIVLSNGEKVPPADMELAITMDGLIEQAMVLGEGKPYLSTLVVLNEEKWPEFAAKLGLDPADPETVNDSNVHHAVSQRISEQLGSFPGYAQIRRVTILLEPWSVDNGLQTPTLKLKRQPIMQRFAREIDKMYEGH